MFQPDLGSTNISLWYGCCLILVGSDIYQYMRNELIRFTQEFLNFMDYINDTCAEVAEKSANSRVRLIHNTVERIHRSEKWGVKYMQRWEEIAYERQNAYEEGHDAGRMETLAELVCMKTSRGMTAEEIAEILEIDIQVVKRIREVAKKYEPGYDLGLVCKEVKSLS